MTGAVSNTGCLVPTGARGMEWCPCPDVTPEALPLPRDGKCALAAVHGLATALVLVMSERAIILLLCSASIWVRRGQAKMLQLLSCWVCSSRDVPRKLEDKDHVNET